MWKRAEFAHFPNRERRAENGAPAAAKRFADESVLYLWPFNVHAWNLAK
jgi:hypothetical protein